MRIAEIHIRKQDYPRTLGTDLPSSNPFEDLKKSLKEKGILTPVFVDTNGVLIQGHYRLWAWQALGNKHVPAIVVEKEEDILKYLI